MIRKWIPISRYKITFDKNGKEKQTEYKFYKTQEEFNKDYPSDKAYSEIKQLLNKTKYVQTYRHSKNGKIYTRTYQRLTYKGFNWKVGK